MRVCPRCRATYSGQERFCSVDQSVLVEQIDIDRLGTQVGNYFLLDILGRGGMGTVYSGEHVYIGKKVAVKVLHSRFAKYEEAIQRFLREARAASSINHPNIVDVTDFGPMPEGGGVFFVMEHLEGTSLEDLIEANGAITLHRTLNVINQMALALASAHDAGVIHRDLKPENIMLIERPGRRELVRAVTHETEGRAPTVKYVIEKEKKYDFVKILDFGIAKVLEVQGENLPGQTLQGAVFGTPEYMSPEAARGDEVDHRADIYSLGVIMFDMLCGRPPFEAQAASDVLSMQISQPTPSPRDANPQVEISDGAVALIYRAMSKDPADRHQSMDELRDEIQLCYGSVAYKRNAQSYVGEQALGIEGRAKRLTDELAEWMSDSEQPQLSQDDARMAAIVNIAEQSFAQAMSPEEQERVAAALDAALKDEDD